MRLAGTLWAWVLGGGARGGPGRADAARAGGASEDRAGALLDLDRLLRTSAQPWCTVFF
jgi:hypothetical protein